MLVSVISAYLIGVCVYIDGWCKAIPQILGCWAAFGDRLPNELATEQDALENSLS